MSRIWEALKQAERQRSREHARHADDLGHHHQAIVLVYGSNADQQPFYEETETLDANNQGCLLTLATIVAQGQRLRLTNLRSQAEVECRVVHVGPRIKGKARVGVAFPLPAPDFWRRQ